RTRPPLAFLCFSASFSCFFSLFFNPTSPPEIYTLSLHDALPISLVYCCWPLHRALSHSAFLSLLFYHFWLFILLSTLRARQCCRDRKSTRLNSSHVSISYAVFCLKKKK